MNGRIINAPWGENKKFNFEKDIIKKALNTSDADSQALLIQQEITDLKHKVDYILTLLDKTEIIYEKELKNKLTNEFRVKFTEYMLNICKLFVQRRVPQSVHLLDRIHIQSLDKLKGSLW